MDLLAIAKYALAWLALSIIVGLALGAFIDAGKGPDVRDSKR